VHIDVQTRFCHPTIAFERNIIRINAIQNLTNGGGTTVTFSNAVNDGDTREVPLVTQISVGND
jgi:hypothetical protein